MFERHVEIVGEQPFVAREWLRRELLWGSLMVPYATRFSGWRNGATVAKIQGDSSRAQLYAQDLVSCESQSLAFFNQGKYLSGLVASSLLCKLVRSEQPPAEGEPISAKVIQLQAATIDKVLKNTSRNEQSLVSEVLESSATLITSAENIPATDYVSRHSLLTAGKQLLRLAQAEAHDWLNGEQHFPVLTIADGGTARSAGPRVEMLTPIFHEILASADYQAMSSATPTTRQ
jgi:hypothetical protein